MISKIFLLLQVAKKNCRRRVICELNRKVSLSSSPNLSLDNLALVATVGILQYSNTTIETEAAEVTSNLKAARTGRRRRPNGLTSCLRVYGSECPPKDWQNLEDGTNLMWLFWK